MESIVSTAWLAHNLHNPNVCIVDCRFDLSSPDAGKNVYEAGHIPGAVYLHLEADLSAPVGTHGGRHPLPDVTLLAEKLGKVGIANDHIVVAYDDQGGAFASRLWWLLRYLGHTNVAILDGGYTKWAQEGLPITQEIAKVKEVTFVPQIQPQLLVDMETVKNSIGKPNIAIIDSRDGKRFTGEEEPIDRIGGHIPSALNYFWKGVLLQNGTWKSVEELQEHFAKIPKDQEIIVYCGSGVTACPNVLALERAGYKNVRLYAGSWSDWITYEDNPVAVGKE